jgi:isopentenyl diphosphate isomerase/L-lactate dehydrogenase-like FMN-dependent dehydrogenase
VRQALKILKSEIARDMALLGCPTIADIDSSVIRRVGEWET